MANLAQAQDNPVTKKMSTHIAGLFATGDEVVRTHAAAENSREPHVAAMICPDKEQMPVQQNIAAATPTPAHSGNDRIVISFSTVLPYGQLLQS